MPETGSFPEFRNDSVTNIALPQSLGFGLGSVGQRAVLGPQCVPLSHIAGPRDIGPPEPT